MNLFGTKNPIIIATTLAIIPYEKSKNTGPPEIKKNINKKAIIAVSYTHLTLPTW